MDDATRGRIIIFPFIAFALILADQVSKHLADQAGIYTINKGISFGLLKNVANINEIMIIVASLALLFFIYLLVFKANEFHTHAGFLLLIAGTAGNLIDRLMYEGVIDFISIGSFPVFNFADAYLTIGVAIMLYTTVTTDLKALIRRFKERRVKKS
jgi:lipoprotein signal peptidase